MRKVFGSLFVLLLTNSVLLAQQNTTFCEQLGALKNLIKTAHYSPKAFDDSLSVQVHKLFIKTLDDNHDFFFAEDIAQFETDKYQLDDYILNGDCDFITKYSRILQQRIKDSKEMVSILQNKTLDYSGKDTLYYRADKNYGPIKDEAHAVKMWNKRIRFKLISRALEQDSIYEHVKTNFKTLEADLKPKVIQNQLCILDEMLSKNGGIDNYVKERFLNAVLQYQDSNSSFFNLNDKRIFENTLSTDRLSFGVNTEKNNDGDIVIAYITPGSPAFKDGNLEANDVLQSLSSGKDHLDTFCVSNDDILAFTNNDSHSTIVFKVKKQNGSIKYVKLTKDLLKVEENTIEGYVVEGEKKFGYIRIQSFYTDMESPKGMGVSHDVAKELLKLEKEQIEGLILDLRFNGGGSMKEATNLSGMFIDRGPVSVLKYNNGSTYTLKDPNRGTIFNKPLVILINEFSASASEFFAGAMQDYNRAILVGSPSYGKASAQIMLPLEKDKDLGYCKLTVEKFYRITGLSHQSKGVEPDIKLPSLYTAFRSREIDEPFALKNDSIKVSARFQALPSFPMKDLVSQSSTRVSGDSAFQKLSSIGKSIAEDYIYKDGQYPLTLDNIHRDLNGYMSLWDAHEALKRDSTSGIVLKNTAATLDVLQYNQEDEKKNAETLATLSKSFYIEEAYYILNDYISLTNTH